MAAHGVTRGGETTPADVLRTLSSLAPAARREPSYDVTDAAAPLLWLGTTQTTLARSVFGAVPNRYEVAAIASSAEARRLAAVDALHAEERLLREGWVFLCGRARINDRERQLCTPLVSQPVRLRRSFPGFSIVPAGDAELTELVSNPVVGSRLEDRVQFGGGALFDQTNAPDALISRLHNLHEWIEQVADAAGLRVARVVGPAHDPLRLRHGHELVAVVGIGIYAARNINAVDVASSLIVWAGQSSLHTTAFAHMYGLADTPAPGTVDGHAGVRSPLPLTDAQREVVAAARTQPVTVVSGPPGCGKSHTLVATAIDAVARGQPVLVATQSSYAAEVLAGLLDRYPGPTPVLFGNAEQRNALAAQIEASLEVRDDARQTRNLLHRAELAQAEVELLEREILERSEYELLATDMRRWEHLIAAAAAQYPALFSLPRTFRRGRRRWRRWTNWTTPARRCGVAGAPVGDSGA